MHIGMFSYGLPVIGAKRSGIERVAHELAEGLAGRGHEVTVWSYDPAPTGASYGVKRLPANRFVTSWLGRRLTMGYLGNVIALLPDFGTCEILIAHGDSLLLPLQGRPVVRVMHGSALGEALSARTPWRFCLQLGVYVQELLSAFTQRGCVGVSSNTRRYNPFIRHCILTGVNRRIFHPQQGCKTSTPSVVCVGTLDGRKRGGLLLDWFRQVIRPRHPEATLDFVGAQGPAEPGVRYHLGLTDAELAGLYRRAWVYASPSIYEGFGLPYLEAMACGTPVLASPNPGSNEILDGGRFGVLAADERFAEKLNHLLSDGTERELWTSRGLERAAQLSLDAMIDRYEEWLTAVSTRAEWRIARGRHVAC